jgi:fucose 4-O-acetylase-like acetyltransferase
MAQARTEPKTRIPSLDIVKGIAILLVVYGHVMGGMASRGLVNLPFHRFIYALIYSFHMPAFFFVSGLFARLDSATPPLSLIRQRARQVLWPYLLWSGIAFVTLPLLSGFMVTAHKDFDPGAFLLDLLLGRDLWFLWTLFVLHAIGIATRRVERGWLLGLAVLAYWPVAAGAVEPPVSLGKILLYLPGFLVGARWSAELRGLLARSRASRPDGQMLVAVALTGFLALSVAIEGGAGPADRPWPWCWPAVDLAQAAAGTVVLIVAAEFLAGVVAGHILESVGVASLAVFLMHPYVQGGTRVLWARLFGNDAVIASVVVQTLAATALPAIAYFVTQRHGGSWLFRLPQRDADLPVRGARAIDPRSASSSQSIPIPAELPS